MKIFWNFFYDFLFLPIFYLVISLGGIFNKKIREGIKGRNRLFEELILSVTTLEKTKKRIWFHSSSMGEFEQAKPIIEQLKKNPNLYIIVSFFSPSGYNNSKKYPYADLITYIAFDTRTNSKKFLDILKPDLAVFMRYDIWPNHIWQLSNKKIPVFLVDATMKKSSPRKFLLVRSFHKSLFKDITKILTVSRADADGFKSFGCGEEKVSVVGDTRFDRVYQKSLSAKERNLIKPSVLDGRKVFVAGSTWEQDEEIILPAFTKLTKFDKDVIMIIAPHEPTIIHLEKIENEFAGNLDTIRFSHLNNYSGERVIIVDSIGILLTLYTYADVAFIGGSFKQNVHNVLEAAVYGIPVIYGPKIENSQEAAHLIEHGGGMVIGNRREAYRRLRSLFSDEKFRQTRGKNAYEYVQENIGTTQKIISELSKVRA
jgi:3-deoxy-D-manno-octulosonic-acid transferase